MKKNTLKAIKKVNRYITCYNCSKRGAKYFDTELNLFFCSKKCQENHLYKNFTAMNPPC